MIVLFSCWVLIVGLCIFYIGLLIKLLGYNIGISEYFSDIGYFLYLKFLVQYLKSRLSLNFSMFSSLHSASGSWESLFNRHYKVVWFFFYIYVIKRCLAREKYSPYSVSSRCAITVEVRIEKKKMSMVTEWICENLFSWKS